MGALLLLLLQQVNDVVDYFIHLVAELHPSEDCQDRFSKVGDVFHGSYAVTAASGVAAFGAGVAEAAFFASRSFCLARSLSP